MSNASIRVFPDQEMMAADMAEALYAALPESTVIQGCELSAPNGQVIVSPGRLIIKGRLAVVVENLTIENPSVSSVSTGHVCAICNLTRYDPSNNVVPVTIEIVLDANDAYNTLVSNEEFYVNRDTDGNITEDRFNSSNGTAFIELATVTVTPGVGVTSLTPTKFGEHARHSIDYIRDVKKEVETEITTLDTKVNNHKSLADSRFNYTEARVYSSSKFYIHNVMIPHCSIAAGATQSFTANCTYGAVNTYQNGRVVTTQTYSNTNYIEHTDANGVRTTFKRFAQYGPQFLRPIGIVSAGIYNASSGGANRDYCYFTGWNYSTDNCTAIIHNSGKNTAVVDVSLRMLYAQTE